MKIKKFLQTKLYRKEDIDLFLDCDEKVWKFDEELGYLRHDSICKDGINGCGTIYSANKGGERKIINYNELLCRINTYGNSFTECMQVSDGETWQEYLAAHFGEPVRNFGIGGYGVYQMYRRMIREEKNQGVKYIIMNIFSDDHRRSLQIWRGLENGLDHAATYSDSVNNKKLLYLAGTPWAHVKFNLDTSEFYECENEFRTREDLYKLCDLDFTCNYLKDQLWSQIVFAQNNLEDVNKDMLKKTAGILKIKIDLSTAESTNDSAVKILNKLSMGCTKFILEKTKKYIHDNGKKIYVLLSYPLGDLRDILEGKERWDQEFIDYLNNSNLIYLDIAEAHKKEFSQFNLSPDDYIKRYYIPGHYNPSGNHFFAFSIKDSIVNWLEPKPLTYQ